MSFAGLTFCNQKVSKKFWGASMRYHIDLSLDACALALSSAPPNPEVIY